MADVVVVGGGVIGLTTAVCLAEAGHRVQVWSALFPKRTTSAVAGAMIGGPVLAEPRGSAVRWQRESLEIFGELAGRHGTGVSLARGRLVSRLGDELPPWATELPGFAPCTEAEQAGFPLAFWISSPIVDMPTYLDYLVDRLCGAGGDIEIRTVGALAEAAPGVDVVVNCTGVAAGALTGDEQVQPVRGQHVVVENPGLTEFFYEGGADGDWVSFFPHDGRVVLGGNAASGDWNLDPDDDQTEAILRRCAAVEPRLANAAILGVEVGLRPGRPSIRLEEEPLDSARLIHCYGHGGVGVSLSWGCAREITAML